MPMPIQIIICHPQVLRQIQRQEVKLGGKHQTCIAAEKMIREPQLDQTMEIQLLNF